MTADDAARSRLTRRQRVLLIGLLNIALMTPPILLAISGQSGLAAAFAYGGIIAISAVFYSLRLAVLTSSVAGVAGVIAVLAHPHALLGAIFFGILTGACALAAKRGLHSPVLMIPIFISFVLAAPPEVPGVSMPASAVLTGIALALGGLWTTASARVLLGRPRMRSTHADLTTRATLAYGVLMGVVLAVAAWAVLAFAPAHQGAWLMLTLIVVLQPSPHDTFVKSLQRLAGTIAGALVALAFILAGVESTVGLIIGGFLIFIAVSLRYVLKRPYWEYVTVLTPAVILLDSPGLDELRIAEDRVLATVIGTTVGLILALAIKALLARRVGTAAPDGPPRVSETSGF